MATPSKWPGRAAPSSGRAIAPTDTTRVEARRVDLVHGRARTRCPRPRPRHIARSRASLRGYCSKSARLAELARVDEDRHDDGRALGARPLDERDVAGVEPAHRGHEADRAGRCRQHGAELGAGADDLHAVGSVRGRRRAGLEVAVERDAGEAAIVRAPARSSAPRPSTSSSTAGSISTVSAAPGKSPASTSAR